LRENLIPFLLMVTVIGHEIGAAFVGGIAKGIFSPLTKIFGGGKNYVEQLGEPDYSVYDSSLVGPSQDIIGFSGPKQFNPTDETQLYPQQETKYPAQIDTNNGGFMQGLNTSVANLVSNMDFSWATKIGENIVTNIGSGISSAWDKIKANVESIFSSFDLSELVENAKTWGGDLVSNFCSGVKEWFTKKGGLEDTMEDFGEMIYDLIHHSTPEKGPLKDDDIWGEHFVQNFIGGITSQKSNLAKTVEDTAYILNDLYSMTDKNITTSIDVLTQDFKLPDMPKSVDIPFTSNANQIFSGVSKAVDDAKSRFDSITFPQPLYKIGYMEKPDTSAVQTAPSVIIQNINVNVEDAKISSDYDVRELGDLLSDEIVETIGEKLKEMDIFGIRAKGGVVW
ncbi:MAG: hypothetical protein K2N27_10385, partial [Ruminococcus sp.]|nr:hypothetical protein [Ruminococcus sp.]